ncbi:hypothetical protein QR680_005131 [Steinernema hermaphroditum]|uniref:Uncharacterized protein n=1 Tax=Steinernema hermaphroditum TaxID=289476 RepID=A0AA39LV40_9BILA|nr:hypothetical protein QR680_005131 [Steinernema hermaphroditum]
MGQQTAAIWPDYARLTFETFASSRSPRKGNSVAAYRSSLHNLLNRAECSTLIKLLEEKRCITRKPHIIRKEDSTDEGEHKARGPIIVSTLPALSQQNALIDSLRGSLLGHVCCGNASTIYQLGDTTLITFLPVGLFAQVICSAPNYANRLEFMTRKQKHSSAVLNALFKLDVLNEGDGFSADDFLPAIPEKTSKTSRGTRLHEVGIQGDLMYGLSIAPKSSVRIGNIPILSHAQDGEKDTLLKFVFWMDETAKLKKKDKLGEVLRSWFPNVDPLTACDAGALGANDFATLFGAALPMFKEGKCSHAFLRGFKAFCSCYEVEKRTEEFFD